MTRLEQLLEWYPDETFLSADGFEDCVIGVTYDKHVSTYRLVYSRTKCILHLVERDGMTIEEADEFFDFNVVDAYVGNKTPLFVDDEMFDGEEPHNKLDSEE